MKHLLTGPDYWNINKHWSLCTSGRKQSPIDIRTDRLVFDHLLGPIQLDWISFDQANNIIADLQALSSDESQVSSIERERERERAGERERELVS